MVAMAPTSGSLTKRRYGNGWRWIGQFKYKDESGKWHNLKKALTDEDGNPILTDAKDVDPETGRDMATRNIRKAQKALKEWRESVEGTPLGGRSKVPDYIASYVKSREGTRTEDSTLRKYREYITIMRPGLEDIDMRDLDAKAVRTWMASLRERGLARSTIQTAYSLLRQTCNRAVENGDMKGNPCTKGIWEEESPDSVSTSIENTLDAEGIRRANALLDSARNPRVRVGARIALVGGLRCGEVCGLRWCDVDLDTMTLRVRKAIGRKGGGTYSKDPKRGRGKDRRSAMRNVPITPALAAELDVWRGQQLAAWQVACKGQEGEVVPFEDSYVVGYADGRFMTPHALGNAWVRLAGKGDADGPLLGLDGSVVTFHGLRHSFATQAHSMGMDAAAIARILGHESVTTTMDLYTATLPEDARRAMDAMSAVMGAGSMWAARSQGISQDSEDRQTAD